MTSKRIPQATASPSIRLWFSFEEPPSAMLSPWSWMGGEPVPGSGGSMIRCVHVAHSHGISIVSTPVGALKVVLAVTAR